MDLRALVEHEAAEAALAVNSLEDEAVTEALTNALAHIDARIEEALTSTRDRLVEDQNRRNGLTDAFAAFDT